MKQENKYQRVYYEEWQDARQGIRMIIKGIKWVSGFLTAGIAVQYLLNMYWMEYLINTSIVIFFIGIYIIDRKIKKKINKEANV